MFRLHLLKNLIETASEIKQFNYNLILLSFFKAGVDFPNENATIHVV